jgi:hypothetical protein
MPSGCTTAATFQPELVWHSMPDQFNNIALPPFAGDGSWGAYPAPDYGADSFDYTGLEETAS